MAPWHTQSSTTVYENAWIEVHEDVVIRPDGETGIYGVVELRNPAVFVVPVTEDDEVVLVEVERYTTGGVSIEVPSGGSDGQDPLEAARRELQEETRLVADAWEPLGEVQSLNGVCRAPGRVFLARGLRSSADAAAQEEEGIVAVRRVPWAEVLELVRTGRITDGESVAALMHAAIALGRVA